MEKRAKKRVRAPAKKPLYISRMQIFNNKGVKIVNTDNGSDLCPMFEYKKQYKEYRTWGSGYYHLSTDGWKDNLLFHDEEEYANGMTQVGMASLLYDLTVYSFVLMPNHIHMIVSGKGEDCVNAFVYLKRKLSSCLRQDGHEPLPEDYCFKLVPIETKEQMRSNYLYVARNPYEKHISTPGGYEWGSGYLFHSHLGRYLRGIRADEMSARELCRQLQSREQVPGHWEFHPDLGLTPLSFVKTDKFYELFPSIKGYESRLVKDYESFVQLSRQLDEEIEWTQEEMADIISRHVQMGFGGKRISDLNMEEKGMLAVQLFGKFGFVPEVIAQNLKMSVYLVKQFLQSKDFGKGLAPANARLGAKM